MLVLWHTPGFDTNPMPVKLKGVPLHRIDRDLLHVRQGVSPQRHGRVLGHSDPGGDVDRRPVLEHQRCGGMPKIVEADLLRQSGRHKLPLRSRTCPGGARCLRACSGRSVRGLPRRTPSLRSGLCDDASKHRPRAQEYGSLVPRPSWSAPTRRRSPSRRCALWLWDRSHPSRRLPAPVALPPPPSETSRTGLCALARSQCGCGNGPPTGRPYAWRSHPRRCPCIVRPFPQGSAGARLAPDHRVLWKEAP